MDGYPACPFGKKPEPLKGGEKDFGKNRVDRCTFEVMVEFSGD
jgi:hypothetical protein